MGNTHLRLPTRNSLREYADENGHKSLDDAVVVLLAEHRELLVTRRENELLRRLIEKMDSASTMLPELDLGGIVEKRIRPDDSTLV